VLVEVALAVNRDQQVLWVCNTVAAAQSIFDWAKDTGLPVTAYHSRFRYKDRVDRHREVVQAFADSKSKGHLAVTTQVAEMSLDLDADLLVTEVAPVPALIQRLGRLNRRVSPSDRGKPRTAVFVEPEAPPWPYLSEQLVSARNWLDALMRLDRPLSQRDLADCFEEHEAGRPNRLDLRCEWLDSGWCASPGPIRDPSHSVTVILPQDVGACRARGNELIRLGLPMPYSARMERWPKYKGVLLAPPETIRYDCHRGATWAD
jgi:CRISPR-associated endonuclease/helicase Cas3